MNKSNKYSRRDFFKSSALGALGTIAVPAIITGCSESKSRNEQWRDVVVPEILGKAPDGRPLKAGLVGCGDRGTGAAVDFLNAGNGLQITAIGDVFPEAVDRCRETLRGRGQEIPNANCFSGFDSYQKVIDSGVDVVLLCTPPVFRPEHFDYAVSKGKHCFIEKPCAVDPVGAKRMSIIGRTAQQRGLSVISGIVWRSSRICLETYARVAAGAIGDIVSAQVSRMGGPNWHKLRQPGWTDMHFMLHNWINFSQMGGDLIVEQFVHEIDLMTWFMGEKRPIQAQATGGRHRRVNGNQYDFMSVVYVYEDNLRTHCTTRQIPGCSNANDVLVYGTKGYTNCNKGKIFNLDGSIAWQYPVLDEGGEPEQGLAEAFVLEHVRLVNAIRTGQTVSDVEQHVQSTLMAIMARESAYTGQFITWDEIMASNQKLSLDNYQFGPVPGFNENVPVSGSAPRPART